MRGGIQCGGAVCLALVVLVSTARGQGSPRAGLGMPLSQAPAPEPTSTGVMVKPPNGPPPNLQPPATEKPASIIAVGGGQGRKPGDSDDVFPFMIQLAPPGPQRLFRLESEEALKERVRRDAKDTKLKIDFPKSTEATPVPFLPERMWGTMVAVAEPNYVCYQRLWFEQRNFERQGWELGILQPGISAGIFYVDLMTMPIHWALHPLRCGECSAGQCLPGDSTPLLWYPCLMK